MAILQKLALIFWLLLTCNLHSQTITEYKKVCDKAQVKIDSFDNKKDSLIKLNLTQQTTRTKAIYFTKIDKIQEFIEKNGSNELEQKIAYKALSNFLTSLDKQNVRQLGSNEQFVNMVLLLTENKNATKEIEFLKNHVSIALDGIPFYIKRNYAKEVLLYASAKKPYDVLQMCTHYNTEKWFLEILESVSKNDPNAIKQFFGTNHTVYNVLRNSTNPIVLKLLDIYKEYGRSTLVYTGIEWINNNQYTLEQIDNFAKNKDTWFSKLCVLRRNPSILGSYSVDGELGAYSFFAAQRINILHDEKDSNIRFASIKQKNAEEIYNLIVYSKEEIFTSTFIGCFNQLLQKRKEKSLYVFLQKLGFNKFRTFIQMCAGYNKLNAVMNTMTTTEQEQLLDLVVADLDKTGGNLNPAVEVADIFGSIKSEELRKKFVDKLEKLLQKCYVENNDYGVRLYGLLFKLTGGDPTKIIGNSVVFKIPELLKVEKELLFPDKNCYIQQIFYDDEDGDAAYTRFINYFIQQNKNYTITQFDAFAKIESKTGNKIIIYCNKPKVDGSISALQKMFEKQKRFADIFIHRGHSYYIGTSIDLLTPNTKVAILGSCGGYHNIAAVLDNSSEAQIVSSKQIGSWTVNDPLIVELCKQINAGTGELDWQLLWKTLDPKLKTNTRWGDYIPPYKNLGVKFVKAFEML